MKRALLPIIALFVALSGVSVLLWQSLERDEETAVRRVVAARFEHLQDRMKAAVKSRFDGLARLAKRFEEWLPTRQLWEADVNRFLEDFPEFQGISWNDANHVVRWFLPKKGNEKLEGVRIDSEPVRREAVRIAHETHALVATKTVTLLQGRRGFMVLVPIFRDGKSIGSIVGCLVTANFVGTFVNKSVASQLSVAVTEGNEVLFETTPAIASGSPGATLEAVTAVGGLSWKFRVAPTDALIVTVRSAVPEMALAIGLLSALLVSTLAYGLMRARRREKSAETTRREIARLNEMLQSDFRTLIETAPIGIGIVRGPHVVFANATLAKSVGYERPGDVVGLAMDQLVHPQDIPKIMEKIRLSATEGVSPPLEIRGLRKGGGITILSMSQGRRINFEGAPAQFSILRDVTDERQLQEQVATADRMATIGLMAAGVAHEINNPLAAAVGNLSFLDGQIGEIGRLDGRCPGHGCDGAEVMAALPSQIAALSEPVADAREALERVRVISRDLKTFARSDENQKGRVDVERVIEASLRLAWPEIKNRARLVKEYGGLPLIWANEARLGQVVLNLIVNAAQAIATGDRNRHQIRVRTRADAGGNVVVQVSDTGTGISPENLGRVWEPFFTTKRGGDGTGLGLSICRRLVEEMGGTIGVESVVGEGTTFTLHLPRAEEIVEVEPVGAATRERAGEAGRARVLVVDDEAGVGGAVRRLLEGRHNVVVVPSGAEALARLARGEKFDVVLLDIMMPEMDGIQLFGRLREVAPRLAERTIFMTGGMANPQVRGFLESVANPRLEKPFDPQNLAVLVNERLSAPKVQA